MALIDNVVGAWACSDNAANTTVIEAVASNNGTASTNTSNLTIAGHINDAFDYNGSNEWVDCNLVTGSSTTKTFSFWVNPDNVTERKFPLTIGYSPTTVTERGGFTIGTSGEVEFFQAGFTTIVSSATLSNGNWYNIVGIMNGTNGHLFVNGVYEGLATDWLSNYLDGDLSIARLTTNYFNGQISDVVYWDRAISFGGVSVGQTATGEVAEIYNSGDGIAFPFSAATLRLIKIAGTFQAKPILTKVAGTFVDKPIKIKVSGTFVDA